jgi:hypothetical protein
MQDVNTGPARPQANQAQAGRRDLVPVAVAQRSRAAQLDDRLHELHQQGRGEGLVRAAAGRRRLPESPVHRLQLRPLPPERRELLALDLRHEVKDGDVVRGLREGRYVDQRQCVQPRRRIVTALSLQLSGDLEARPDRLGEQLEEDLVLAAEVVVQRGLADADPLGDLPGGGRRQALADEQLGGRVEDLRARRDLGVAGRTEPGTAGAPPDPPRFRLSRCPPVPCLSHASHCGRPPRAVPACTARVSPG